MVFCCFHYFQPWLLFRIPRIGKCCKKSLHASKNPFNTRQAGLQAPGQKEARRRRQAIPFVRVVRLVRGLAIPRVGTFHCEVPRLLQRLQSKQTTRPHSLNVSSLPLCFNSPTAQILRFLGASTEGKASFGNLLPALAPFSGLNFNPKKTARLFWG